MERQISGKQSYGGLKAKRPYIVWLTLNFASLSSKFVVFVLKLPKQLFIVQSLFSLKLPSEQPGGKCSWFARFGKGRCHCHRHAYEHQQYYHIPRSHIGRLCGGFHCWQLFSSRNSHTHENLEGKSCFHTGYYPRWIWWNSVVVNLSHKYCVFLVMEF